MVLSGVGRGNGVGVAGQEIVSSCKFQATRDKSAEPIVQVDGVFLGGVSAQLFCSPSITSEVIGDSPFQRQNMASCLYFAKRQQ